MHYNRHYASQNLSTIAGQLTTPQEISAWYLLRDWIAANEKPIPLDLVHIARWLHGLGLFPSKLKKCVLFVNEFVPKFFSKEEDGYHDKELDRQIKIFAQIKKTASQAGKISAQKRAKKNRFLSKKHPIGDQLDTNWSPSIEENQILSFNKNEGILNERMTLSAVCASSAHPLPASKKDKLVNTNKILSFEEQWTPELPTNAQLDHLPDDEVHQFIVKLNTAYQLELSNYTYVFGKPPIQWLSNHEDHGHRHRLAMLRQAIHQGAELR